MQSEIAELLRERQRFGEEIDARVAAETPCPNCGALGSRYQAKREGGRYVALAICRKCGCETEF